jgi:hypothetical protein
MVNVDAYTNIFKVNEFKCNTFSYVNGFRGLFPKRGSKMDAIIPKT